MIQKIVIIAMCFSLVACGGLMQDRTDAYLQAEEISRIVVPGSIGSLQEQETYAIPDVMVERQTNTVDFIPPGMDQELQEAAES